MRARLISACSWLLLTPPFATGCRLDPINPPALVATTTDARIAEAGGADRPIPSDVRVATADVDASLPDDAPPDATPTDAAPPRPDLAVERSSPSDGPREAPAPPEAGMPDPLLQGLVAHWRFDEGMGTAAADSVGNGNVLTLFNGTVWERSNVPGRPATDRAIRLDGSNDYLSSMVNDRIPRLETNKTIAFWFTVDPNAPAAAGTQRTCLALVNADAPAGLQMGLDRDRPAVWLWGGDQGFVISPAVPSPGAHHLAYTYDGTTHRLYLDGTLADTAMVGPQPGRASVLYLGTYEPPNELCAGQIDDLRIYNRALPLADLTRLTRPN